MGVRVYNKSVDHWILFYFMTYIALPLGPGGWGTLICSYIRRLGSFFGVQNSGHFWGFKILNFNFFFLEFLEKYFFAGYDDFVFFPMHFRIFS